MQKFTLFFIAVLAIAGVIAVMLIVRPRMQKVIPQAPSQQYAFAADRLNTNTAIAEIPLEKILDGGPGKDGIPAIREPKFTSVADASSNLRDDSMGILVTVGNTARFYPYYIFVWHEIVNDRIEGKPLLVTFCPLCGSAIVFDPIVDDETLTFGVSGKLYENNLLMYDHKTESLWPQILGRAVVGDMTGKILAHYPSQVLTFAEVKEKYPHAEILSENTGFSRAYGVDPYGDYEENDEIFFPLSVRDTRFPLKEIMFIVNIGNTSAAFPLKALRDAGTATVEIDGAPFTVEVKEGEVMSPIPGYYAMWFSWAVHHQEDGIVWKPEKNLDTSY